MSKRIVLCSDGTGNSSIKGRGTNVFKLYEAIDLSSHRFDPSVTPQIAFYDDGVGTENFKPLKIIAGITGAGLGRNVRQLYKELVRVYEPGDEIYLFGFSRGAFTVRTLVGFIATCGLPDPRKLEHATASELNSVVKKAYRVYRSCFRTKLFKTKLFELILGKANDQTNLAFRKRYSREEDVRVRFLGLWDTVDAVGLPFHLSDTLNTMVYRFKFPDRCLSSIVDQACHALALDDERHSFHPLLWDETQEKNGRIEQVWFAGAHSNVGGGYPKQGMSLVALDWMLRQAELAGLRFNASDRRVYREHANVDDKRYDPCAGLGIFYRWKPRDTVSMCREHGIKPKVHVSVLERVAHGTEDYAPGNLPPHARVVFTEPEDAAQRALLRQRAITVARVLHDAHITPGSLLTGVTLPILFRRAAYYVYLISCTAVLAVAGGVSEAAADVNPWALLRNLGVLLTGLLTYPMPTAIETVKQLWSKPLLLAWLAGGFLAAFLLDHFANRRMSSVFSEFWHRQQPTLRNALERARSTIAPVVPAA